ncbi:hypothetical protein [uncultured Endozoicomonas sp.]|uniref:hypothetical protein n=1 Tax=uncultured Endozoicomonas sp. TaxID=432652 RepID=UPI002610D654|nr:hypothetical protein [uncultured Endozoicomonas sp.]
MTDIANNSKPERPLVTVTQKPAMVVKVTEQRITVTAGESRVHMVTAATQGLPGRVGDKGEPGEPGDLKPDGVINGGYF